MTDAVEGGTLVAAPTGSDFSMRCPSWVVTAYRYDCPPSAPATWPDQMPDPPIASRRCPRQPSKSPSTSTDAALGAQTANHVPVSSVCAPRHRCRWRWVPSLKRWRSTSPTGLGDVTENPPEC